MAEGARPVRPQPPRWLVLAAVAGIGLNLRPFLTAVGPLAPAIRGGTGLSYQGMAWLTLLPMLLMGVGAFFGPAIRARLGARTAVLGALALLGAGCALRLGVAGGTWLIASAALCGLGVAVVQAACPGLVKQEFPARVAPVMGLYSAALMGGGALGAQLSPYVTELAGSWREALALWAVPALAALALAWVALPHGPGRQPASAPAAPPGRSPIAAGKTRALLRRPRTWLLMISFGVMNGGYASLVAWLAPFYQSHGWSAPASGSLVALMAVAQAAAALLLPALAARRLDRRAWMALALAMQVAGFAGLALRPDIAPHAWAVIGGAGLGGCFALYLVVALDHLPDADSAGALSAVMQGGGFLLASLAPWITAMLQARTGSFAAGWWYHLACAAVVGVLTMRLDPARYGASFALPAPTGCARQAG
ncbi:putative cyanate transporter (cynX), MFS family [Cupriavidus taiwanensis]|uniref:Cyanate transporter (CynX), MFS family n=1 Tax=Cupriavidus taiwanensis TaxID=164546 RepID=A0A976B2E0_9BURK|nr:cyanate transporter [Cupriavidus taiwanensis]SOZ65770.1 putative cyanate transporter (cynX), MFS family [Cupriavidus taiwanensis]SOZ68290.1 putative cyanate transporter (cynX), MFS family [Cupriavidus taiwanensis]SOZ72287.1 putative cyanate transporter (cynX), MFS family [Cupriavidus taiwanensis]SPA09500.1 putative cyanate transporter (cynX), MFS family [Cupriavidus taiwanensis]